MFCNEYLCFFNFIVITLLSHPRLLVKVFYKLVLVVMASEFPSLLLPTLSVNLQVLILALVFLGCACFPLLRPYNTRKLSFCSHECLLLGYSKPHKGYKCLSPSARLYISKDVISTSLYFLTMTYSSLPLLHLLPEMVPSLSFSWHSLSKSHRR